MDTEPLLKVCGLCAGYGETEVLRGIDLSVNAGEIVAVLGSNGVGKSTLNRTISGIVRARAGSIHFDGVAIERAKPAEVVARGLIHVPEGRRIFPNLSVRENLDLGSYRRGGERRAENRERVFATFPRLFERQSQRAGTLSGGEQQMLAIGRGLMAEPKLIILDEPSLGLVAAFGRGNVRTDRAHQRQAASRCCWSSRTWCRASKSPIAPISWPRENSSCRARPRTSAPIPSSNVLT